MVRGYMSIAKVRAMLAGLDAEAAFDRAVAACILKVRRFNPNLGTAFNYFTKVAQRECEGFAAANRRHVQGVVSMDELLPGKDRSDRTRHDVLAAPMESLEAREAREVVDRLRALGPDYARVVDLLLDTGRPPSVVGLSSRLRLTHNRVREILAGIRKVAGHLLERTTRKPSRAAPVEPTGQHFRGLGTL